VTPAAGIAQGEDLRLFGEIYSPDGRAPNVLVGIVAPTARRSTAWRRTWTAWRRTHRADRYAFALTLPHVDLLPGKYLVRAHALDPKACASSTTSSARSSSPARRARWASCGSRTLERPAQHADGDAGPR
jgi:hypothetical protein